MKTMYSYDKSQAATGDLPFGAFTNETSPGSKDGTDIKAEHMQDLYYSLYQVLQLAGVQPNGNLENGNTSKQFLSALGNIAPLLYSSTTTYNINSIVLNVINNEISVYKSLAASNQSALTNSSKWLLLAKINSAGVFGNMTLNSPILTGTPTSTTAAAGTANTQIATTAFVKSAFKNFLKITTGKNTNGAAIYPPTGFTMSDLIAFIPAISDIYYSGDVDHNDHSHCNYTIGESYITLTVYSSEQRAATYANWIAVWVKS